MNFLLLNLVILACLSSCQALLSEFTDWVWGKSPENMNSVMLSNSPLKSVPFELLTQDEKFLLEASNIVVDMDLVSPLEICQQKVVLKLKSACGKMSEDELAKFSVELLNCQSAVEGRQLFTCTESMSIAQCTKDMGPETWNAYHVISNRARAVCYNIKNMHFRAATEMTINRLVQSTQHQVKALMGLQENHEHLVKQADKIHETLESNVQEAMKEKDLISSGHEELNLLMMTLKQKLYNFSNDFQKSYNTHNESSHEILQDLKNIELQAGIVLEKIETSTNRILNQHEDIIAKYDETLIKIETINSTIFRLWDLTKKIQSRVQKQLDWVMDMVGTSEKNFAQVYHTVSHMVYLIGGMIITSFLNMSYLSKFCLVIIVPTNLAILCKHGSDVSLDLTSITAILVLIFSIELLVRLIEFFWPKRSPVNNYMPNVSMKTYTDYELLNNLSYSHYVAPRTTILQKLANEIAFRWRSIQSLIVAVRDQIKYMILSIIPTSMPTVFTTEERSCSYDPISKNTRQRLVKLHSNISEDLSDTEDDTESESRISAQSTVLIDRTVTDSEFSDKHKNGGMNNLTKRSRKNANKNSR